ncbi:MAG: iron ABC transporter permease [Candidatus Binatia bacterium]|nr:iron ABC transporter permease [Candidatus Binatia bacterium]
MISVAPSHSRALNGYRAGLALLALTVAALVFLSLFLGAQSLSAGVIFRALFLPTTCGDPHECDTVRYVVFQLRLPRSLVALGTGIALAVAGVVLQALWRNPLADAGVLGVSTAAALGAAAATYFGTFTVVGPWIPSHLHMTAGAFAVSLATLTVLYKLAGQRGGTNLSALLLLGIACNAIGSGVLGLFLFLSSDAQLRALTFWTLGSAAGANWLVAASLWSGILTLAPILYRLRTALDVLLLGEHNAFYLGFKPARVQRVALVSVALLLALAIAATGPVAFVGLIVPHTLRLLTGAQHRTLLPLASLAGGLFVLASDLCARTLASPAELPLSLVTASAGGPALLLFLKLNSSPEHWR